MNSIPQSRRRAFRTATVGIVSVLALTALAACSPSASTPEGTEDAGEVRVYDGGGAWGDAQAQAFFKPFEEETGIKVIPIPGDAPAAMRTTIEAGNPSMDVVDLSGTDVFTWGEAGLLEPVNADEWTTADAADFSPYPVLDNAVPSLLYAAQISWDKTAVPDGIDSWADFWKTSVGKVTLGDGSTISTGIFEAALLADGVAPDKLYPLDIDRAFTKLTELRPNILKFWESGAESVQLLADGQVAAAGAYNGRVAALQAENDNIGSTWNEAVLSIDYWGIAAGSPNADNARKFIEFASRPDRQAEFASLITYAPTNSKAYDDIDSDRQTLLPTAPQYADKVIPIDNDFWNSDSGNGTPWSEEIVNRWQKWLSE